MATWCRIRRRAAIERRVGDSVIVISPTTGEIRLLGPTAALVWRALDEPREREALDQMLAEFYPQVRPADRVRAIDQILDELRADGLVIAD